MIRAAKDSISSIRAPTALSTSTACPDVDTQTGSHAGRRGFHTVHRADRTVSLAMGTLRRSPREAGRTRLNLNTLSTGTTPIRVLPRNNDGLPPYGSNGHTTIHRRSASGYSRHYSLPELVLPSPLLLGVESNPLPPMSPRGPRPLPPTPGQLNRSATLYSQIT